MRYTLQFLTISLSLILSCSPKVKESNIDSEVHGSEKILFVCTSVAEVNEKKNGTFLSEIAVPFILLEEENFEIDILSPKGGEIPIYYKFDTTEVIQRALSSIYYKEKTENSLQPNKINPADYKVIIIPGGYGQFWDIHQDTHIQEIIADIYETGGIIASLGHGTSSLVPINVSSGEALVKDKTLTCFPSWFEKEVMFEANYGELLPFDMEVELEKRGAKLKRVDKETRSNAQIVDVENRIITASSATGGEFIAGEIIKLMKQE
ncbi:MAG: DJ-1/PfpI family protein [Bacteroidota bacterium]